MISETIPDGTIYAPGQKFTKTWEIKNTSNCSWNTSYKIVFWDGNTLGGAISWAMGYFAERTYERVTHRAPAQLRALAWLQRFGPKACLLSWLPLVGDPLCAVAGWLRLPFWPCVFYMMIGKFGRYVVMTSALLWFFPGQYTP